MRASAAGIVIELSLVRHATWALSRPYVRGPGVKVLLQRIVRSSSDAVAIRLRFVLTAIGLGWLPLRISTSARLVQTTISANVPAELVKIAHLLSQLPRRLPHIPGLSPLWSLLRVLPERATNAVYRLLFRLAQRQGELVRRFFKPLAEPSWSLATSRFAARYLHLAARLQRRRPRLISRIMFRIAQNVHISILGIQLASGQTDRSLKLARMFNLVYRHVVRERQRPGCHMYFEALFRTMRFDRIVKEVPQVETIDDHYLNHEVGVAHLYMLDAQRSIAFLERAIAIHSGSYIDHRMLGRAHLLKRDIIKAQAAFNRSVELQPVTVMAHQNYAGRYDVQSYKPKPIELKHSGELLIYDNLGQFAEDLFLQGRFHDSFRTYQQMLDYQRKIAPRARVPNDITRRLARANSSFDRHKPIRVLPYEWVIQFGHIGLLDIYMKMAKLGMYPDANYVLLAPEKKVANAEFLRYWDRYFTIVRDGDLVDDLFPYQRYIGDNFMAYPSTTGEAEPWTRAGARAQIAWAEKKRRPLLSLAPEDRELGRRKLAELGVPENAWYVGLHVREGGYYCEASTGISTHRNASIDEYAGAIDEITSRGGYVIRLGDKSMRPLSPRARVIDYAVSPQKSASMDIFLLATSRFVIGTTSGLTTACLSFGRPMVLVNCISNDWQLWSKETDFIPKRLRERQSGRYLTLGETYRQPVQGYLINNVVTNRRGFVIEANTADEITDAVRYKLDILDGVIVRPPRNHPTMAEYWQEMANNTMMFGAAQPVVPFLERHPDLISNRAVRSVAA
jgi:putative glycosyltransferase (TIGR04372 family)